MKLDIRFWDWITVLEGRKHEQEWIEVFQLYKRWLGQGAGAGEYTSIFCQVFSAHMPCTLTNQWSKYWQKYGHCPPASTSNTQHTTRSLELCRVKPSVMNCMAESFSETLLGLWKRENYGSYSYLLPPIPPYQWHRTAQGIVMDV